MHHRIGVGVIGIDPERLRQPRAVGRLNLRSTSRVATKRTQREQKMQTPS
jgi:hypothetical protein